MILRPLITYDACPIWTPAAKTNINKLLILLHKILRRITDVPWYFRNKVIEKDLKTEYLVTFIENTSKLML